MHPCRLADKLDMSRVLVPRNPGLLSAFGMLDAEVQRMLSSTVLEPLDELLGASHAELRAVLGELEERARDELSEYVDVLEFEYALELRYQGQSFEIRVPVDWSREVTSLEDPTEEFERRHETLYGYRADGRTVELVTVRLRAFVPHDLADVGEVLAPESADSVPKTSSARVGFSGGDATTEIIARSSLEEGGRREGPCVITEYSSTTVVPPGWSAEVRHGHLLLEQEAT